MKRIKIVGFFILLISVTLVLLASFISNQEQGFTDELRLINTQRSHTQEIAKSLFFAHRYKRNLPKDLDTHTYHFMKNLHTYEKKSAAIEKLSQEFFTFVNQFKYVYEGNVPYNIIILDKLINNIYKKNMGLVVAFTHYADKRKIAFDHTIQKYKVTQYILFVLLILLLLYLFSQMDEIMRFIQTFTKTSDHIMKKSSIKGLTPIDLHSDNDDLGKAAGNFNTLVQNIDTSIKIATDSTAHTIETLESVEQNIELLVSLIHEMQSKEKKNLYKKEDTIIESLETLMALTKHLKDLKKDLRKLL